MTFRDTKSQYNNENLNCEPVNHCFLLPNPLGGKAQKIRYIQRTDAFTKSASAIEPRGSVAWVTSLPATTLQWKLTYHHWNMIIWHHHSHQISFDLEFLYLLYLSEIHLLNILDLE